MQSNQLSLSVSDLSYGYNDSLLFEQLSFDLSGAELLQVVGANGVGKSTLLKVLSGLIKPNAGDIAWQGYSVFQDLQTYQANLFYLGHQIAVQPYLTVYENLTLDPRLTKKSKAEIKQALDYFRLSHLQQNLVSTCSRGQKQKIALAKLMLSEANLYLLDEPFSALDSEAAQLARQLIKLKQAQGAAVILTTHQSLELPGLVVTMEELSYAC